MTNLELMKQINEEWQENEESMGEMAALEVACQMNGKTSDWFWDHIDLLEVN